MILHVHDLCRSNKKLENLTILNEYLEKIYCMCFPGISSQTWWCQSYFNNLVAGLPRRFLLRLHYAMYAVRISRTRVY